MRFQLVDQVISQEPDRIQTVKAVTNAEEYLADHFPGFPVLPGVLMVEAMVQAARKLLDADPQSTEPDFRGRQWVLAEVRNVRYGNMVRPGQLLCITVERTARDADSHTFKGVGTVDDDVAVQGKFVMRPTEARKP